MILRVCGMCQLVFERTVPEEVCTKCNAKPDFFRDPTDSEVMMHRRQVMQLRADSDEIRNASIEKTVP